MAVGELVAVALAVVGGIVWLVRLEGRINTQDDRHEHYEHRFAELRDDVKYIRQRIDSAVNNGKH